MATEGQIKRHAGKGNSVGYFPNPMPVDGYFDEVRLYSPVDPNKKYTSELKPYQVGSDWYARVLHTGDWPADFATELQKVAFDYDPRRDVLFADNIDLKLAEWKIATFEIALYYDRISSDKMLHDLITWERTKNVKADIKFFRTEYIWPPR